MEDAANNIVAHYERHALSWDADRRAAGWTDKPYIERFLGHLPAAATVLDLGCGGGDPVALHMAARGFHVTGIDSSPTLISLCQNRMPDQQWIAADMRTLALGRRFQGILAWDSFFHLSCDDQRTDVWGVRRSRERGLSPDVQRRPRQGRGDRRASRRSALPCEPRSQGLRSFAGPDRLRIDRACHRRCCKGRSNLVVGAGV